MTKRDAFVSLVKSAFLAESIKKLVFSRPKSDEAIKVSARLCAHRGRKFLALEYSLPSGTVKQENLTEENLEERLCDITKSYNQANLITPLGDCEYKVSKKGKEALLGAEQLERKLSGDSPAFEKAIEELDRRKSYILSGSENFLTELGISDKNGRIHDKKQGKFRQINRFLEHIEDIYSVFSDKSEINIYDLCCGKSYLSFAVYYYLTEIKKRKVSLLGIDLKRDVIDWCSALAKRLSYNGMRFICDNIKNTPVGERVDMVISLHACDVATDIVIDRAAELSAKVILSTPCCHRYMNGKINAENLAFITRYPHLSNKMCEALTDALRAKRLEANGYSVTVAELTDPENTPKNTLIKAILKENLQRQEKAKEEYESILEFLFCDKANDYLSKISK